MPGKSMHWRNGPHGYGVVTKVAHWVTVVALATQFAVGWTWTRFDDVAESGVLAGVLAGLGVDAEADDGLLVVHATLGVAILVLAAVRTAWRRSTPLPPWADALSAAERRWATWTERTLYVLLWAIPLTGLGLVLLSGEDWELGARGAGVAGTVVRGLLVARGDGEWAAPVEVVEDDLLVGAHVATHLLFLAALASHLALVVRHTLVRRDGLLGRMT